MSSIAIFHKYCCYTKQGVLQKNWLQNQWGYVGMDKKFITFHVQQGKSEGFDSSDRPSNLTEIGFKSLICQPQWPWNLMGDLKKKYKKNRAPLLYYVKLSASFQIYWWIETGVTVWKRPIQVKIGDFFVPCDLEIGWMTFSKPWVNSNWSYSPKCLIRVKIGVFCPVWSWNMMNDLLEIILHLFYAASSFVHHFIAVSEFKLELQSGNAQFGSK